MTSGRCSQRSNTHAKAFPQQQRRAMRLAQTESKGHALERLADVERGSGRLLGGGGGFGMAGSSCRTAGAAPGILRRRACAALASSRARSSGGKSSASASRSTVLRCGAKFTPRSSALTVSALMRARSARSSCESAATRRNDRSTIPNGSSPLPITLSYRCIPS